MRTVSFVGLVSIAISAYAHGIVCGWVVDISCPGCSPSVPSDSSCYCGPVDQECVCRKISGGMQTGSIITCNTGPWNYLSDNDGPPIAVVSEGAPECYSVKRCMKADQSQLDCGELSGHGCVSSGEGGCSWRVFQAVTLPKFVEQAGECEDA